MTTEETINAIAAEIAAERASLAIDKTDHPTSRSRIVVALPSDSGIAAIVSLRAFRDESMDSTEYGVTESLGYEPDSDQFFPVSFGANDTIRNKETRDAALARGKRLFGNIKVGASDARKCAPALLEVARIAHRLCQAIKSI